MATPTYNSGFYAPSRGGEPAFPSLWRGCCFAAAPCLGPTGLTLRDWSGSSQHSVLTNMDPATDWVTTSQGRYALDFDGSNDRVETASRTAGQFLGNQPFSVSVWFRATSFGRVLVARRGASPLDPSEWALFAGGSGTPFAYLLDGVSYGTRLGTGGTAGRLVANTWHHMVMTWSGGTTYTSVTFWVDGKIDAQNNVDSSGAFASIKSASLPLTIGSEYVGTHLNGQISDVRLYRRILSPSEIRSLALRPGIAYELAPRRRASSAVAFNRRRRLLVGA